MNTLRTFLNKPWLYLIVIFLGTALKFFQLDSKLFWRDEISSILYTSGMKEQIIQESIPVNQIKSFTYYDSILHLSSQPLSLQSQITGILSDTHLTPAHYVFLTLWYRLMGDDVMDYRLFSVFIFVLSLPFVFLLAKTLYNDYLAGWIAMSLFAVSPFIHFEAQEARYYILWVFFFVLSNYMYLEAIRNKKIAWWIGYSLVSILAMYTSATSGLFIFGHLVYVLLFKKENIIRYGLALCCIVLAYLPWMYFLYTVQETIQSGLAWHKILHSSFYSLDLLFVQLLGLVRSFVFLFDFNMYLQWFSHTPTPGIYSTLLIDLLMLGFISYSLFYLFTNTSKEIRWFLLLIILPLFLLFYLSDIIRSGFTSLLWRYQIVNMVVISLIVANLLKDKITKGKILYIGVYFGLVFLGIASILKIAANRCWMTSPDCEVNIEDAQLISQAAHPLLITDFNSFGLVNFLAVINESKAKSADILYSKGPIPNLKEKIAGKAYTDIYILEASDSLAQQVKTQLRKNLRPYRKEVNMFSPQIWKIEL